LHAGEEVANRLNVTARSQAAEPVSVGRILDLSADDRVLAHHGLFDLAFVFVHAGVDQEKDQSESNEEREYRQGR
jgi:hypothetical protein